MAMLGQSKTRMLVLSSVMVMLAGITFHDEAAMALTKFENCTCKTTQNNAPQLCGSDSDINWYSWFMGESGSAQFHYLDLLELLLGSGKQSDSGFTSNSSI
ncbi:hypothetical protein PA25_29930 [Pseudoalteromonas sp. A25]|uniref:hypothetical protein n=1 Tax=Pseudoalteromonas sp. A25 TaxID=116092 RepID=UPI0012A20118|nr:hypothetical protein [Pseudoalteromonas sp. A25]BBN83008.1 hypothetical protein PA25_29930 [Pseudoalteromonas sp. A25]